MKKALVLAILILLSFNVVLSQIFVNGVDISKEDIEFCEIVGYNGPILGKKVIITIGYGAKYDILKEQKITDENNKKIVFNSMIDALNFMNKMGWEYIDNYAVSSFWLGGGKGMVLHYLLRKKK